MIDFVFSFFDGFTAALSNLPFNLDALSAAGNLMLRQKTRIFVLRSTTSDGSRMSDIFDFAVLTTFLWLEVLLILTHFLLLGILLILTAIVCDQLFFARSFLAAFASTSRPLWYTT